MRTLPGCCRTYRLYQVVTPPVTSAEVDVPHGAVSGDSTELVVADPEDPVTVDRDASALAGTDDLAAVRNSCAALAVFEDGLASIVGTSRLTSTDVAGQLGTADRWRSWQRCGCWRRSQDNARAIGFCRSDHVDGRKAKAENHEQCRGV